MERLTPLNVIFISQPDVLSPREQHAMDIFALSASPGSDAAFFLLNSRCKGLMQIGIPL